MTLWLNSLSGINSESDLVSWTDVASGITLAQDDSSLRPTIADGAVAFDNDDRTIANESLSIKNVFIVFENEFSNSES